MALNPRQLAMLQAVREQGSLKTETLAEKFDTTLQTVRRDIQRLTDAGVLERFHGGVRALDSSTRNTGHTERQRAHAEAKQGIARTVAAAIPAGASLFMNIGTTVEAVAKELLHHQDLHVVTNNLHVASTLAANAQCEVVMAGGTVRHEDLGVVGEAASRDIQAFIAYSDQLPSKSAIIADPKNAKVPDQPGACAVVVYGLITAAEKDTFSAFMEYIKAVTGALHV